MISCRRCAWTWQLMTNFFRQDRILPWHTLFISSRSSRVWQSKMAGRHFVFLHFILLLLHSTSVSAASARILIYSATERFRHDSIPTAINALKAKGSSINAEFVATEDRTQFTDSILAGFDALVFLSTTGEGMIFSLTSISHLCRLKHHEF